MFTSTRILAAAGASVVAALTMVPGTAFAAPPSPVVIDFTGETSGMVHANGYSAAGHPEVRFSDTYGDNGLYTYDLGSPYSNGPAIMPLKSGYSALQMALTHPTTGMSLAFGYDLSSSVDATDQGELRLYRGSVLVDQVDVNLNANGALDQRISYNGQGRLFNRATFQFVDASGNAKNAYELIDDIDVNPLCTVSGGAGHDHLVGTSGDDVICGDQGSDSIRGGSGNDLIYPGPGNDHVYGGGGADTVMGSAGNDVVEGAKGSDDLRGGDGRDRLFGGLGNDKLAGGTGRDTCNGGPGNDYALSCEVKHRIP